MKQSYNQYKQGSRRRQHNKQRQPQRSNVSLRIIPLGGQEEVGRNMTVFEYGNDIIILDMGLQFPEEDMPGIDYIIPNTTYLRGKEKRIRAVVFSHGHLDHIGAAPILLQQLGYPLVIGRPLTIALIKNRLEDFSRGAVAQLKSQQIKTLNNSFRFGPFTVRFFQVDHSIMDAVGVIVQTPSGTVIHPGDWTYEKNPIGRKAITYRHLSSLPRPTLLMLESLGAIAPHARTPERTMYQNLENLIRQARGRVIIGTFSSQLERIRQIIEYAQRIDKKVALDGYSMRMNVEVAKQLGYIKAGKKTLIPINQIHNFPDRRIVVLCTGAQGEGNAVLSRIVSGDHRFVKIKRDDTIVFSSSVIPGNERTVQRLKDNLYRLCDNVIHTDIMEVHSGGHSNAEDIVELLRQIQPTYFLPVYANHYMLKEAGKLAVRHGFNQKNIAILDNGSVLELRNREMKVLPKKVPTDHVFVDGLGVGDVSNVVLRDRQLLAKDGIFIVIVTIEGRTGRLVGDPDITTHGFIQPRENQELIENVRRKVKKILRDGNPRTGADEPYIKNQIRDKIGQYLFTKTERRPMVLPVVIEV
ncbi:MAG: ribonuclease J [Patescibacteria group bacterium]|nr:ribonuclease J [Patescibacteria group bacterium]MDD5715812.1 ribonuclease J [Patescibacteria group bacterium]